MIGGWINRKIINYCCQQGVIHTGFCEPFQWITPFWLHKIIKLNMNEKIKIRDIRNQNWFWLGNDFIDKYSRILGASCSMVYVALCRHSDNKTQQAFPGMRLISEELKMGTKTVERATKKLKKFGLIEIDKKKNKKGIYSNNTYTLLPIEPSDILNHQTFQPSDKIDPCPSDIPDPRLSLSHQTPQPHNNTQTKNTKIKKTVIPKKSKKEDKLEEIEEPFKKEINHWFPIFSRLNKNWKSLYGIPTQRQALANILQFAKDDGIGMTQLIDMAQDLHGVEYAPQIFTPLEMANKYSKLMAFRNKKINNPTLPIGTTYTPGKFKDHKEHIF